MRRKTIILIEMMSQIKLLDNLVRIYHQRMLILNLLKQEHLIKTHEVQNFSNSL